MGCCTCVWVCLAQERSRCGFSFYTPHTALRRVTASDVWPVGAARLVSLFGKPPQALHEYSTRLACCACQTRLSASSSRLSLLSCASKVCRVSHVVSKCFAELASGSGASSSFYPCITSRCFAPYLTSCASSRKRRNDSQRGQRLFAYAACDLPVGKVGCQEHQLKLMPSCGASLSCLAPSERTSTACQAPATARAARALPHDCSL